MSAAVRDRLVRFFEHYAPDRLANVDKILTKFEGREAELFETLVQKYGPEPGASGGGTPPPATPEKATSRSLVSEPSSPSATGSGARSRLTRFFQHYAPEKLANVDKILAKYEGQEDELFRTLVEKYGPEPGAAGAAATPAPATPARDTNAATPASPSSPQAAQGNPRDRLTRFFQHYAPEKLANVDKILAKYEGQEDELFRTLVEKYGPEPSGAAGAAATPAPATPARDTNAATPASPAPASPASAQPAEATPASPAASAAPTDARSRLTRFFQHYAPEKLANVDKILQQFAGREDELWSTLIGKYGPEPAAEGATPQAAVAQPADAPMDPRSRLTRFFQHYAPEKLANVDKILQQFAGREDELWSTLIGKYGPEPAAAPAAAAQPAAPAPAAPAAAPMDTRSRLTRFFQHYAPEKVANVDKVVNQFAGREDELWKLLNEKYGPEPAAPAAAAQPAAVPMDNRSRLVRYFEHYNKERLPQVDQILQQFAGREHELWPALQQKYGPEPPAPAAAAQPAGGSAPMDPRSRLTRFFQHYAPEKLANVDKVVNQFAGREDELWKLLNEKYGPEPAAPAAAGPAAQPAAATPAAAPATAVPKLPIGAGAQDQQPQQSDEQPAEDVPPEAERVPAPTRAQLHAMLVRAVEGRLEAAADHIANTLCRGDVGLLRSVVAEKYHPETTFEWRLRRALARFDWQSLASVDKTVEEKAGGDCNARVLLTLTRDLVLKNECFEPAVALPEKSDVKVITIAKSHHIEEEELSDIEDEKPLDSPLPEEAEVEAVVGHSQMLRDVEQADPGECSGDESKTYSKESERWLRLRFGTAVVNQAPPPRQPRERTFTEFVPGRNDEEDDDEEDDQNQSAAAPEPEPTPADDEADGPEEHVARLAIVSTHKGREQGAMCVNCSPYVIAAFDALWTPVGARHRQLMQANARWDGWAEKLSGGTFGSKWQRRFFRITSKGLHYYETDKATERPKGHKAFTRSSKVVTDLPPARYPKCADTRFHYVGVTVNETNELFLLRCSTDRDSKELTAFLKEALERLRLTMVGQDPNPGRWRARMGGLVDVTKVAREEADTMILRERKARHQRDKLREELRQETDENTFLTLQGHDLDEQEERLKGMLDEARRDGEREAEECKRRVQAAAEAREGVIEAQAAVKLEIEQTKENTSRLRQEVQQLQCLLVDKTEERRVAEQEQHQTVAKWRRAEERTPTASQRRARRQEGLAYRPKEGSGARPPSSSPSHSRTA